MEMTVTESNDMKKEYLNGYKKICRKIESLKDQEATLRSELENAKAMQYSDMPKGNKQTDLSDSMVRLEKLQEKIREKQAELMELRTDIEDSVTDMQDGTESDVIRMRYLELKDWEQICVDIGFSWRQTHRIHSRALSNFNMA